MEKGTSKWPLFLPQNISSGDLSPIVLQERIIAVGQQPMLCVYGSHGAKRTLDVAAEMASKMTNVMSKSVIVMCLN